MGGDDLVGFCLPNLKKCAPAVGDLIPNAKEAIEYFLTFKWVNPGMEGSKAWTQGWLGLGLEFWYNIPLCLGTMCVPCCMCVVHLRNMEKMSGKSCESECLTCCVLQMCCYLYTCYYAKKRSDLRKKYGLKGSGLLDCVGLCCCGPCVICGDANQIMSGGGYNVPYCSAKQAQEMRAKVLPQSSS